MSAIQKEALVKMCGVWLCITDGDSTRIVFWSQILGCKIMQLKLEIEKTKYLVNNKTGRKHNDVFLETLYDEVKHLPIENIKSLFNKMRKEK